jgi:hypothetical protein
MGDEKSDVKNVASTSKTKKKPSVPLWGRILRMMATAARVMK